MKDPRTEKDVKVAPNIYRTKYGWRVYIRRAGKLKPIRFPASKTIEWLILFRDQVQLESRRLKLEAGAARPKRAPRVTTTFAADADAYLALPAVAAMPSIKARRVEIARWVKVFGDRTRDTITSREIDAHLQAWRAEGLAGSTVNKLRTALMSMWTRLDGRSARNPVRDTGVFEEASIEPRGQPYSLLTRILDAVDPKRSRGVKGKKGSAGLGSLSRARLELLAWTGMDPSQIKRMVPGEHFSVREGWYISPRREKGSRRRRMPLPTIKKPMNAEAKKAFRDAQRLGAFGPFDTHSLRKVWFRALRRVERQIREREDPEFVMPHIRLKDLRHSFGTELYRRTKNLDLVGEMLDHTNRATTKRYAVGAVSDVLRGFMIEFSRSTGRKRKHAS